MEPVSVFTELGKASTKIAHLLSFNQAIAKLLINTTQTPLSMPDLDLKGKDIIFNKNIRTKPAISTDEIKCGFVVINWATGTVLDNYKFSSLSLMIDVFCPISMWDINDECQRPFLIMDRIYRELNNKSVTGIGTLNFVSFELIMVNSEIAQHKMLFEVNTVG